MLLRYKSLDAAVLHDLENEIAVGKRLLCCSALGNKNEESALQVQSFKYGAGIVRVHVGNESGIQLFCAAILRSDQIDSITERSRSQIRATDSDLDYRFDFLTGGSLDLSASHLLGKILDLCKFTFIEGSLLHSVGFDLKSIPGATTGELMKNQTLFTCIHHLAAQKSLVLVDQLLLIRKNLKGVYDLVVDGHGSVVVAEASRLPDCGALDAFGTEILPDVERFLFFQL